MSDEIDAKLRADLAELADAWDQEARDRRLDGLSESAATLRGCRDELRAILRRHGIRTGR